MQTFADKHQVPTRQALPVAGAPKQSAQTDFHGGGSLRSADTRLGALQQIAFHSQQGVGVTQCQNMADISLNQHADIQTKTNHTGLPDSLKAGVESLSGYAMDDVKVHYNSDKPAQLNAHAFAQGTDIHLAPQQEKHLPHEVWHVVQQKQGRVKPTVQFKNANINNDKGLEREADIMGRKALLSPASQVCSMHAQKIPRAHSPESKGTVQRYIYLGDQEEKLEDTVILEQLLKMIRPENKEILESAFSHSIMPVRGNTLEDIAQQIDQMGTLRDANAPWRDIPDDPSPLFYGVASPTGAPTLRGDKPAKTVGRLLYMGDSQGMQIIDNKNIFNPKVLLDVPYSEVITEGSSPLGLIGSPKAPVTIQQPQVTPPQTNTPPDNSLGPPPPPPPKAKVTRQKVDPKTTLASLRAKSTFRYHEQTAARKISEGVEWKNPYVDKGGVGKWYNTSKRGIDWATTNGMLVYFALDNLDDTQIPSKKGSPGKSITASELRYTCRLYLKHCKLIPGESLEGNFANIIFLERGEIVAPPWIQKPGLWNSYIQQVLDKYPQLTLIPLKDVANLMLQNKNVGAGNLYREILQKLPKELWTSKMKQVYDIIDQIADYHKMDTSSVAAANHYIGINSALKNL